MKRKDFLKILEQKKYSYIYNEETKSITVNHNGSVKLENVFSLPKNVGFKNIGMLDLSNLREVPSFTIFSNKGYLNLSNCVKVESKTIFSNSGCVSLNNCSFIMDSVVFVNNGDVEATSCFEVRDNNVFKNNGDVHLTSCLRVSDNICFENDGGVFLDLCKKLGKNVIFKNQNSVVLSSLLNLCGSTSFENHNTVYLMNVESVPEKYRFSHQGSLKMNNCKVIGNGALIKNHGSVHMECLETIPEGFVFQNSGRVFIPDGNYVYNGKNANISRIDGIPMILTNSKQVDGFEVYTARYFCGGFLSNLETCYIALGGGFSAHGEKISDALRDLRIKIERGQNIREKSDLFKKQVKEICSSIKEDRKINYFQWSYLTGACRAGTANFLKVKSSDLPQSMDIDEALIRSSSSYFGNKLRDVLKENDFFEEEKKELA